MAVRFKSNRSDQRYSGRGRPSGRPGEEGGGTLKAMRIKQETRLSWERGRHEEAAGRMRMVQSSSEASAALQTCGNSVVAQSNTVTAV